MAIHAARVTQGVRAAVPVLGIPYPASGRAARDDAQALWHWEPGWALLSARNASPTQQFIWTEAFAQTFEPRLHIVAVGPPGDPAALAPLVRRRGFAGRLEALSVRELYEPMDLLYAQPATARDLAEALVREGRALWLPRVPADSAVIGALRAAYRGRGIVRVRKTHGCPFIALGPEWVEPERRFNAGRRSDFRRALRHAEKTGKVAFEVLVPSPVELPALLEQAWAVEAAGWKGDSGSALAHNERLGAFFRRYAEAASRRGILRLCFMRLDGRAIAMQLGVESGGRFWLLKIGYDEQFARCSPGNLLMLHTVRYAAQQGLQSYELLGRSAPWTEVWAPEKRACVAVRAWPFSARGIAALALDGGRRAWRRLAAGR